MKRPTLNIPSSDRFVRDALSVVGRERRSQPYWFHWVSEAVVSLLPEWAFERYVVGLHEGLRARALKRKTVKQE